MHRRQFYLKTLSAVAGLSALSFLPAAVQTTTSAAMGAPKRPVALYFGCQESFLMAWRDHVQR